MPTVKKHIASGSVTRNSPFRERFALIPKTVAREVLNLYPRFNPNYMTASSALLTTIVSRSTVIRNRSGEVGLTKMKPEAVILIGAQLLDSVDGATAREKNDRRAGSHDTKWGGLWDALNDRYGSAAMGISRITAAHERNDVFGKIAATLATLTAPLPAFLRSRGESRGEVFAETGNNPLGFFGTHAGRTILAIPATLLPNAKLETPAGGTSIQAILDTFATIANGYVIRSRLKGGKKINASEAELNKIKLKKKLILEKKVWGLLLF